MQLNDLTSAQLQQHDSFLRSINATIIFHRDMVNCVTVSSITIKHYCVLVVIYLFISNYLCRELSP